MKHELSKELLERAIADWEAARNEIPFGLGEEGENTLAALKFALAAHEQEPVSFDELRAAVFEMTGGRPTEWSESTYKGHQVVPFINFNSLSRIVEKFRTHPAPSIPTVSFYRDGIAAAAAWVEAQREAYDSEHGHHDPDTGTFEFGNDAQLEYSSTLAEIAEGIRALHPNATSAPSIPAAVQDEELKAQLKTIWWSGGDCHCMSNETAEKIIDACRAAMLNHSGDVTDKAEPQNAPQNIPVNIPDGYALVPLIAFPSQWAAGQKAFDSAGINKVDAVYKAMVAAAPKGV